jgi:type II secretory pathway component PulF
MRHARQHAGLPPPREQPPHPPVPFESALLELGEETGKLDECLRLLAEYFGAEHRAVLAVLRKAAYPVFTGVIATIIAPLPLLALGRAAAYQVTVAAGLIGWVVFGRVILAAFAAWYLQRPKYVLGRLLRSLTIAIEAGLTMGRAAQLAAAASGSAAVQAHVALQGARVLGQPLSATFLGSPLVPATALAALRVAESTGNYSDTLTRLADLYGG